MGNGSRGRPRVEGERYPSGKRKPGSSAPAQMPSEISGALWQRMQQDHAKFFSDATFATELTRLGNAGKLTPREVSTGLRIAGIYGRFEYYKGLSRSAGSPHYIREFVAEGVAIDVTGTGFTADDAGELGQGDAVDDREAREQEAGRAFKELQRVLPVAMRAAVEALCVENVHIGYGQLIAVREALGIVDDTLPDKTTGLSRKQKRARRKRIRPVLEPATKAAPVKLNPLKTAFLKAQRALSPHLDDEGLERAWELLSALKSREDFRLEKAR
jgi:hypothetical protein